LAERAGDTNGGKTLGRIAGKSLADPGVRRRPVAYHDLQFTSIGASAFDDDSRRAAFDRLAHEQMAVIPGPCIACGHEYLARLETTVVVGAAKHGQIRATNELGFR
jgi:hypothetical protein